MVLNKDQRNNETHFKAHCWFHFKETREKGSSECKTAPMQLLELEVRKHDLKYEKHNRRPAAKVGKIILGTAGCAAQSEFLIDQYQLIY